MYRDAVVLSPQMRTVRRSITSTGDTLLIRATVVQLPVTLAADDPRADPRRRRRPRRPGNAALRLPAPRPAARARGGAAGRPRRAAVRRGPDGAARPARA